MGIENFHLPNSSMQILMVADELRYELISARVVTGIKFSNHGSSFKVARSAFVLELLKIAVESI